jgi:hypothetical protein
VRVLDSLADGGGSAAASTARIAQRFLSGEWGVELDSFEADRHRDRERDQALAR